MNGTAYTPRPGSVAMRAITHLEKLPAGTELSSAALAEAIGVESNLLGPNMHHAELNGAVCKRKKFADHPRAPLFWSLPKPADRALVIPTLKAANGHAYPPALGSQQVLKAEAATPDATDRETPATTSPRVGAMGAGQAADAAPKQMRIALWSDGTLQIERSTVGGAAELVLLCRDEMRQLVAYLDSIALDGVREAA